jgi:23S rRNA pseudouridine1911/1915/1917 synthase
MTPHDELNDELYETRTLQVDAGQGAVRIDKFLCDRLEHASRNKIQNAIRAEAIRVNNAAIKPNYKVRPNDVIQIVLPKATEGTAEMQPEDLPLNIEYEDADILIVNKEPGMVVHPGISNPSGTLVNALLYHLRSTDLPVLNDNPQDRAGLVHRIDKNTSGLLVIAKNDLAMTHLARQFFEHTIEREYVALVWGAPDPSQGTIEGNIGRDPRHRLRMSVYEHGDGGKEATTHYETVEDLYYVSLVKCRLETGRTHQIRVHMQFVGHPVFNDERYGGNKIMKGTVFSKYKQFVHNCFNLIPRHALHAQSLGFIHPGTGKHVRFESALPDDMQAVVDRWRNYVTHRKELT